MDAICAAARVANHSFVNFSSKLLGKYQLTLIRGAPTIASSALVNGGTFVATSFLYDTLRASPERSTSQTLLEKGLFFGAVSYATFYKLKRTITPLTPGQAAGWGVASWLFATFVRQAFTLTPLEKTYNLYTNHPSRWLKCDEEERLDLIKRFFTAGLPPIRARTEYHRIERLISIEDLLSEEDQKRLLENPETFTKNQLGWIVQIVPLAITKKTLKLANHLLEKGIPMSPICDVDGNCEQSKEFLQRLIKENSLYYYINKWIISDLDISVPKLKELNEVLTTSSIQKIAPYALYICNELFKDDTQLRNSLDVHLRIAFYEQFSLLDFKYFKDIELLKSMRATPEKFSNKELNWLMHLDDEDKEPEELDSEDLKFFQAVHTQGVLLPWFTHKITEDTPLEVLHGIYNKYPLYQFLQTCEDTPITVAEGLEPLPSFSSLVDQLTQTSIQKFSNQDIRVWLHVFNKNKERWNTLDTTLQLAFIKKFQEENPGQDFPLDTHKIDQDLRFFPDTYSRSEITTYLECLTKHYVVKLGISELQLFKRAKEQRI